MAPVWSHALWFPNGIREWDREKARNPQKRALGAGRFRKVVDGESQGTEVAQSELRSGGHPTAWRRAGPRFGIICVGVTVLQVKNINFFINS